MVLFDVLNVVIDVHPVSLTSRTLESCNANSVEEVAFLIHDSNMLKKITRRAVLSITAQANAQKRPHGRAWIGSSDGQRWRL